MKMTLVIRRLTHWGLVLLPLLSGCPELCGGEHHQNRHSAFSFRHNGNQRNGTQRHGSHADTGPECEGELLGRKLEPIIADPASDWPLFAEKARDLLANRNVAVVFGCWTSASRKSVLPVFEELNGLLYYPVQYEGEESSRNIFYTGAAPNQQAIPAVQFLMSKEGGRLADGSCLARTTSTHAQPIGYCRPI